MKLEDVEVEKEEECEEN